MTKKGKCECCGELQMLVDGLCRECLDDGVEVQG